MLLRFQGVLANFSRREVKLKANLASFKLQIMKQPRCPCPVPAYDLISVRYTTLG